MASNSANPSPANLEAADYVAHLWKRRLLVVALTFLAAAGTYAGLMVFHPNIFEARSLIMVRQQPRMNNMENDRPGIDPPSFRSMFVADDTIEFVRHQYNDMVQAGYFKGDDAVGHERIETPLEKLRPRFRTESSATVDTTITTEFSPVIELNVRGVSQGQALALMNLWTSHILNKYGNLLNEEANFLIESSKKRTADLQKQVGELTAQQRQLQSEQQLVEARIASALRQLTWAPLPRLKDPISNEIIGYNMYSGPRESSLTIEQGQSDGPPGLYERRTQVGLELARGGSEADLAALKGEKDRVETEIPRLETQVKTDGVQAAEIAAKLASLAVELNRLEYAVRLNSTVAAPAEGMLRDVVTGDGVAADDPSRYGTLRLLAKPVVPMEKVWPRRSLLALSAGGGTFIVLIVLFCCELYLRAAVRLHDRTAA